MARAAERLDISRASLAKVPGINPPAATRLYNSDCKLDEHPKE